MVVVQDPLSVAEKGISTREVEEKEEKKKKKLQQSQHEHPSTSNSNNFPSRRVWQWLRPIMLFLIKSFEANVITVASVKYLFSEKTLLVVVILSLLCQVPYIWNIWKKYFYKGRKKRVISCTNNTKQQLEEPSSSESSDKDKPEPRPEEENDDDIWLLVSQQGNKPDESLVEENDIWMLFLLLVLLIIIPTPLPLLSSSLSTTMKDRAELCLFVQVGFWLSVGSKHYCRLAGGGSAAPPAAAAAFDDASGTKRSEEEAAKIEDHQQNAAPPKCHDPAISIGAEEDSLVDPCSCDNGRPKEASSSIVSHQPTVSDTDDDEDKPNDTAAGKTSDLGQQPDPPPPVRSSLSSVVASLNDTWNKASVVGDEQQPDDPFPIPSSFSSLIALLDWDDLKPALLIEWLERKKELKKQLKKFDQDFARKHGRPPVMKGEKGPVRHLYKKYNTLKRQIAFLEQEVDGDTNTDTVRATTTTTTEVHQGYSPSSEPPPNLRSQDPRLAALKEEKLLLHHSLRSYERDFLKKHNRNVSSFADIKPIASKYRRYKKVKKAIQAIREKENNHSSST